MRDILERFDAMQDALRNLTNGLDLGWERGYFDPMARKAVDAAHEKARAVIAEADAICTTL